VCSNIGCTEQHRPRTQYTFPPSPTSPTQHTHTPPLSQRLRLLQAELASLEAELADPSNPQLHKEREEDNVDPGELIRGLVDVRGRLEKIRGKKEGRGKLVSVVTGEGEVNGHAFPVVNGKEEEDATEKNGKDKGKDAPDVRSIAEMDRRVGELEELVGSSSTALDEVHLLPFCLHAAC
jgi:nuclear migration protein JNM1